MCLELPEFQEGEESGELEGTEIDGNDEEALPDDYGDLLQRELWRDPSINHVSLDEVSEDYAAAIRRRSAEANEALQRDVRMVSRMSIRDLLNPLL